MVQNITIEELNTLLVKFNDTAVDYPRDMCLHELFEMQVARTPESVAVAFEGTQLTYSELNKRANQLAWHLHALGVGPEILVGVYMERSLEMVIALYGILKAGGAYVPLDPEYPRDRVTFMLEDTNVQVVLTQKHLLDKLPEYVKEIVCLDTDWAQIESRSTENISCGVTAENLAYVIYTSGSTGQPKGAMNCHMAICNRLLWMQDLYQLGESDRILQKTPFSFDVSVWEFFWPLLFGARMVVAKPGGHRDANYLANLIIKELVTTIHFVPSMLRLFLDNHNVSNCRSLKRVICSGEALSFDLQEQFFNHVYAELYNLYGPTEAAVDVTYWACERGSKLGFVPIGRPAANVRIYVLDDSLNPVPIGEPGELHIGGIQVGRGYLNRPKLTEEMFIADPFCDEPGARLYKTGDLACFLPSGDLKYLGRIDNQVKIRGNRIEPGEIEAVLEMHHEVKQAVVLAWEDEHGEKRLFAYIATHPDGELDVSRLRLYLEEKLPIYMIPSAFVILDTMPLLPNGKVDRRSLPKPSDRRPELGQAYVAPRNELEKYLSNIWCEILQLDRVGIHDRFFELGGTSLQAARFINKLQQEFGENIYIVSIFESPTIAEYVAFLLKNYARSLERRFDIRPLPELEHQRPLSTMGKINEDAISRMYECIPSLAKTRQEDGEAKNPPAIFVLAPPRSGTTLLRVMLAGSPELFAASELQLLGFHTLKERRAAYTGKFSLWLEGTIRVIMELRGCDAEEAVRIMDGFEQRDLSTKQFYGVLQEWIGNKLLVDKSPSYVLDMYTLEKAEDDFRDALYIHLVRHPYSMVQSFESYHMDQVLYLKAHPFSPRQLGELVWLISHKNAMEFLRRVPKHRQYQLRFEDLVNKPQVIMEDLCKTFQFGFYPDMVKPYEQIEKKMTDGIYEESKPMGDTRFLEHGRINPEVAKAWEGVMVDDFLSDITWELAATLGYDLPDLSVKHPDIPHRLDDRESTTHRRRELLEKRRFRRRELRKE